MAQLTFESRAEVSLYVSLAGGLDADGFVDLVAQYIRACKRYQANAHWRTWSYESLVKFKLMPPTKVWFLTDLVESSQYDHFLKQYEVITKVMALSSSFTTPSFVSDSIINCLVLKYDKLNASNPEHQQAFH